MKIRISLLLLALGAVIYFTGCDKDKTPAVKATPTIVGKWKSISDTTSYYTNGEVKTSIFTYPDGSNSYFAYNADGTAYSSVLSGITYTVNGSILTVTYPDYGSGTTAVPGRTITIDIRRLTDTQMVIYTDLTVKDANGKLNGNTVTELYVKVPVN